MFPTGFTEIVNPVDQWQIRTEACTTSIQKHLWEARYSWNLLDDRYWPGCLWMMS